MVLDLNTLLYVGVAATTLAAGVLSLFGATQGTHNGFRFWVAAQWVLAAALLLHAVFGTHELVVPLVRMLVLQWPIVVLIGMRRMHMRKAPAVPPGVTWHSLRSAAAWSSRRH
jgi:hypothetical protein